MQGFLSPFVMLLLGAMFATCGSSESQHGNAIKRDHEQIGAILDRALLSETPMQAFHAALDTVRAFPSVDSAWITSSSFFVRYKHGGVVSWTIAPQQQPK